MTESFDPKRSFADRGLPVGESLRFVRNEGGGDAIREGNPEICLTAAIGMVRALEGSLKECEIRHRMMLEGVRELICDVRRSIGAV